MSLTNSVNHHLCTGDSFIATYVHCSFFNLEPVSPTISTKSYQYSPHGHISIQPPWDPTTPDNCSTHYFVGDALPAAPPKLVERIEPGAFIEMRGLSPEHLGQVSLEEIPKPRINIAQYLASPNGSSVLWSILL